MESITLAQLLEAVGGRLLGDFDDLSAPILRVDTDSRSIHPGSLFIPLTGARFDGHAYIDSALEGGAAGCLTARERERFLPEPTPSGPSGTWPRGTGAGLTSPSWG